jgi:hypothetical protein
MGQEITGLKGHTGDDPIAAAVAAGLKTIKGEIDGVAARVAVYEDKDILKSIAEIETLKAAVKGLEGIEAKIPEDREQELKDLAARLDGVQAQLLSPSAASGEQKPKSLGETIFEDEGFQAMISKSSSNTKTHKINLSDQRGKSALSVPDILAGVSAAPVLGAADLGPLRWSTRQVEIVTEPKEDVAAFVPAIGVIPAPGFQVYEWPYETTDSATGYLRTTLSVALTGSSVAPTDTAEVADASHFVVGTLIRFFDPDRSLNGILELKGVDTGTTPNQLIFDTDAIDWDQDADTNITSEHWLGTPESEGKPYTLLAGDTTSVNAVTIAIMTAVTRQQLLSPSGIMAWINDELPDRTVRNIAQQLLYGAGTTGKSLLGFWSHPDAAARTYKWSEGEADDNRLDAVMRALLMVVGGAPSIVMNKTDLQTLRLLKDANDGQYLHSMILGKISLEKVSGQWVLDGEYPIIKSEAVKAGDFLICDFTSASKIIDAEDEALEFGVINDDFSLNQRRARYERTLAHAIQRTNSFVLGLWDSAPTP